MASNDYAEFSFILFYLHCVPSSLFKTYYRAINKCFSTITFNSEHKTLKLLLYTKRVSIERTTTKDEERRTRQTWSEGVCLQKLIVLSIDLLCVKLDFGRKRCVNHSLDIKQT